MFNTSQVRNMPRSPARNSAEVAVRDAATLRLIEVSARFTGENGSADVCALADHDADGTSLYAELIQRCRLQP